MIKIGKHNFSILQVTQLVEMILTTVTIRILIFQIHPFSREINIMNFIVSNFETDPYSNCKTIGLLQAEDSSPTQMPNINLLILEVLEFHSLFLQQIDADQRHFLVAWRINYL